MASSVVTLYVIATEPLAKIPYGEGFIVGYTTTALEESEGLQALVDSGVIRSVSLAEHAQYQIAETAREDAISTAVASAATVVSDAQAARDVILGLD